MFEELEAFLQEHKIAFTRESTGRYEFDPETVEFRPGHPLAPQTTNGAGQPVVLASELAPVADLLAAALDLPKRSSTVDSWSLVKTARQLLQEQLLPALPPLETFEVQQVEGMQDTGGQTSQSEQRNEQRATGSQNG